MVIWTTTPWTIPANLAIAVHADFTYTLVRAGERRYLLAEELVDEVMKTVGIERFERVGSWKGSELEGVVCRHPFYDRESPVILGDHVTLDAGTGCVHTAPGHGEEDFLLGQKYGLGVLCPVDEKGRFTSEAPGFEGMFYDDANKAVTEKLEEVGALLKLGFITHQYPHDWRTKKPVIFRATEQWFASIDGFRRADAGGDQGSQVDAALGRGSHRQHDRRAERLVHFPPAGVGRSPADLLLREVRSPADHGGDDRPDRVHFREGRLLRLVCQGCEGAASAGRPLSGMRS